MIEWVVLIVLVGGILWFMGQQEQEKRDNPRLTSVIRALRRLHKYNWKLLVRPTGQIAGVVVREEPWFDSSYQLKRRRLVYYDLDGDELKEPRDYVNRKTNELEDLIVIEADGGIALTQSHGNGSEMTPILFGWQANKIKRSHDDYVALEREMRDFQRKYDVMERNYKSLQRELNLIRRERDNLENQIQEFREANTILTETNERLRARVQAAEAARDMLIDEFKSLKSRHRELTKEVDDILKRARERQRMAIRLGAVKVEKKEETKPEEAKPEEVKPEQLPEVAKGGL